MRSTSTPSLTTVVFSRGMPSATSRLRIASELAMKQSTWPYFQRENELWAMRNSTRREATSGGLGVGDEIESAVAAIATACGSCACTTSGRSCRTTRDSRQAAARSISCFGARGIRSSPSDMRLNSAPSGCATSAARWSSRRRPSTVYIT